VRGRIVRPICETKRTSVCLLLFCPESRRECAAGQRPTAPSGGRFCNDTSRTSGEEVEL
jgi:hypothetical protein